MADLFVCGYPRSGNVWLSRLLGDALDRSVVGTRGTASFATKERLSTDRIMQAPVYPGESEEFWCSSTQIDLDRADGRQFVYIVRDPRDVLVSMSKFWDWSLEETMRRMVDGPGPLELPPWKAHVGAWLNKRIPVMRYEDFHRDAEGGLAWLLEALGEKPCKPLDGVVHRQSFDVKRTEMERHGDRYPFGRDAQLRHLRKGETGEWKSVLPSHMARLALTTWRQQLAILGYHQEALSL